MAQPYYYYSILVKKSGIDLFYWGVTNKLSQIEKPQKCKLRY